MNITDKLAEALHEAIKEWRDHATECGPYVEVANTYFYCAGKAEEILAEYDAAKAQAAEPAAKQCVTRCHAWVFHAPPNTRI